MIRGAANMPPIQRVDLRRITRDANRCLTFVTLHWGWETRLEWIVCGAVDLRRDSTDEVGCWTLTAYLNKGAADFEHDAAHAFGIPLIGVTFSGLHYSRSTFTAWIDSSDDSRGCLRVPPAGYDPAKLKGAIRCTDRRCGSKHLVVPEGYYYPPHDASLYDLVKGKRVDISTGPALSNK
jgi:hypothetical protein